MKKMNFTTIITILLIIVSVVLCSVMSKDKIESTFATTSATADEKSDEEMRGLWVSFISLDMSGTGRTYNEFKSKFDKILSTAKDFGCNTLIVQVRPFCDALYKSEIFPASHILSGIQGNNPGYDALEYMCERTHSAGLKLHAWINPYRVATSKSPEHLSENNPYIIDGIPAKLSVANLIAFTIFPFLAYSCKYIADKIPIGVAITIERKTVYTVVTIIGSIPPLPSAE